MSSTTLYVDFVKMNKSTPIQRERLAPNRLKRNHVNSDQQLQKVCPMDKVKYNRKFMKIQMIIEDNGVGISDDKIDLLFQDYKCLDEHQHMN